MIISLVVIIVCLLLTIWHLHSNAKVKETYLESQLLIHKEFFNGAIRDSVLATDYLVEKIINATLNRMEAKPNPEVRSYIKNVVIREIGQLRHVDNNYYRCLGTFNKDR